ncbi:Transcription initiation factor IIA subunit 2 [Coemansia thaxteri]|uniref:Transcription initiation factor IIA subunit 2 n=1 Tax=Coemansia thaxteri TaxID=2663907 RepID=A0A9W8BB51_9FUNG|nr:Transcription initiation factor IIA subunit 2 [Coemansia thaxteri]KAJ2002007.1 Transcription initiation factor IIA subunit 2 [Coemansia thaxteri]KAJ2470875.1 Transcription initiation factor IIA subunit 2 [Coemansia sp. RSA 2322]KAJ2481051.1 Transcription initiation factor IIA subunit 2 [Coemansia sp. RSA 2320]
MPSYYTLYRAGTLGSALIDSLNELVTAGHVTPQLAIQVLEQFDKSLGEALVERVKAKAIMKGRLEIYRNYEEVWTLILKNATFKAEGEAISADKVKIVACSARRAGE